MIKAEPGSTKLASLVARERVLAFLFKNLSSSLWSGLLLVLSVGERECLITCCEKSRMKDCCNRCIDRERPLHIYTLPTDMEVTPSRHPFGVAVPL